MTVDLSKRVLVRCLARGHTAVRRDKMSLASTVATGVLIAPSPFLMPVLILAGHEPKLAAGTNAAATLTPVDRR
ncbi:MAG: hypothetical protein B7X41_08085 [Microbacterium sp. 14-71-5]|nr:MAG: hypothetical protein B7X41_08085 [Microbacterium sp. 14-71-5]